MVSRVAILLLGYLCAASATLPLNVISDSDAHYAITKALEIAHDDLREEKTFHEMLFRNGIDVKIGGANVKWTSLHLLGSFRSEKKSSVSESEHAFVAIRATQELSKMLGKSVDQLLMHPNLRAIWRQKNSAFCSRRLPKCPPVTSHYRTADGSCNNLANPTWGMSNRPQKRYLPSFYSDGVSEPRMFSVTGKPLPSARLVSNIIHKPRMCDLMEPRDSALVMQWGQTIDHDFAETPMMKGFDGSDIECCQKNQYVTRDRPECFPISIPDNDKHFSKSCMNFVRSTPGPDDFCEFGVRNQLNEATAFVDASYIYGNTEDAMDKLRAYSDGQLKMNNLGFFMEDENQDKCTKEHAQDYCMKSGDGRIHVVPGLTSTQVIMMREHNRIARILSKLNPHWSDEITFQETRKIISAVNQHTTYNEYLPTVLGQAHMKKYGLFSRPWGYDTVYHSKVDPTMANVFAVAAFRFGHSQIPGDVFLINEAHRRVKIKVEDTFNRPSAVLSDYGKGCDHVNRWLVTDRSGKSDRFLEPGVRDKLFLDEDGNSFDLAALNIQRGRDHGIPGYNAWRKWCGLPIAYHFGHGPGGLVDMEPESAMLLSKLYEHPDDIDLFTAGIAEKHVRGGAMGRTFACIVAQQFVEWKKGDRFWYENNFGTSGFTEPQLNEIKKIRMSAVMCNHMAASKIQPNVFRIPSSRNPMVPCDVLPQINLGLWKTFPRSYRKVKVYGGHAVPVAPAAPIVW